MAIALLQISDGQQCFYSLQPRFANSDEQPSGEGNFCLSGKADRFQPDRRKFVRRSKMRHPFCTKPLGAAFQHQSHRSRQRTQDGIVMSVHYAGIKMRQKAGFFQHQRSHIRQIVERAGKATVRKPFTRRRIAILRPVAQRKQRLPASLRFPGACNFQNFLWFKKRCGQLRRAMRKCTIMANIPAQFGQRNEDLARISYDRSMP